MKHNASLWNAIDYPELLVALFCYEYWETIGFSANVTEFVKRHEYLIPNWLNVGNIS